MKMMKMVMNMTLEKEKVEMVKMVILAMVVLVMNMTLEKEMVDNENGENGDPGNGDVGDEYDTCEGEGG